MDKFKFNGLEYQYFFHPYNDTSTSERCVEIPLAMKILQEYLGEQVLEVGNVLTNYFTLPDTHHVIDKNPEETGAIHQDILHFEPLEKYDLIISISTLEHVGLSDGPNSDKIDIVLEKFKEMLKPSGLIWASMPIGYNPTITRRVKQGIKIFNTEKFLKRVDQNNRWVEVSREEVKGSMYGKPWPYGNALIVGWTTI
jgi:hypothetical protein